MRAMDSGQIICQQLPTARKTLRVAVVTETYPPEVNGVAMTISRMVAALQQRQHQVQLIRPRQSRQENAANTPGLEEVLKRGVAIPRYDNLKMGLPAKQALLRLWALRRPDVVHIVTEGPLGWSALAAAVKLRIPCSSDFHTNFQSYSKHYGIGWLKKPIVAYLRKFHNKASCTLVPTSAMRDDLEKLGYINLRVVARGVDTGLFNPAQAQRGIASAMGGQTAATGRALRRPSRAGKKPAARTAGVCRDESSAARHAAGTGRRRPRARRPASGARRLRVRGHAHGRSTSRHTTQPATSFCFRARPKRSATSPSKRWRADSP